VSIFVDPPLLMADGETFARLLPESAQGAGARVGGALTVAGFWAIAAGLWTDQAALRPFRKGFGYSSGREFMLRYPLPDRGRRHRRNKREEAVAIAMIASYPFWWWLGWDHGRRARPRSA
jgi:hypothetical protein